MILMDEPMVVMMVFWFVVKLVAIMVLMKAVLLIE